MRWDKRQRLAGGIFSADEIAEHTQPQCADARLQPLRATPLDFDAREAGIACDVADQGQPFGIELLWDRARLGVDVAVVVCQEQVEGRGGLAGAPAQTEIDAAPRLGAE